jgi:hypothetical protein
MKTLPNITSILAFCASALSGQAALKYHVLAITPGLAQGVNDRGDVAGTRFFPTATPRPIGQPLQTERAFLYKGGKITDLGVLFNSSNPFWDSTLGQVVKIRMLLPGILTTQEWVTPTLVLRRLPLEKRRDDRHRTRNECSY